MTFPSREGKPIRKLEFSVPDINRLKEKAPASAFYSPEAYGLRPVGRLKAKRCTDISGSCFGLGFEMLDRWAFDPERAYPHLAESGVKWARVQTGWNRCETTKGVLDFAWLDAVVDNLLAIGIQPWFSVSYGNLLYTPDATWEGVGGVPLYYGREALAAWKRFVKETAAHFKGRVLHWEVWNEPNTGGYWPYEVDTRPEDYTELVRITSTEIRSEIPEAVIIGGATSRVDMDFTVRACEAGLLKWIDRFSCHPYGQVPEQTIDEMQCLQHVLNDLAGKHVGLWQGECGFLSRRGVFTSKTYRTNEYIQAKFLLRRLLTDFSLGCEVAQFFHACDSHDRRRSKEPEFLSVGPLGVLDVLNDYRPKMSFGALQCLCTLFDEGTTPRPGTMLEVAAGGLRDNIRATGSVRRVFQRRGVPMYTYYYPEHPCFDNDVENVFVVFWTPEPPGDMVLIDPVFNRVYAVPVTDACYKRSRWVLEPMPMMDYPLVLTSRSAVVDILEMTA